MNQGFWATLVKPFTALAPMEGVTDTVLRQMVAKVGKPDVFFTEFTSVDGLCSEGKRRVTERLVYTREERPIVAQLWGVNPQNFYKAAGIVAEMGFDGIDINFGCPARDVTKFGACGAMISTDPDIRNIVKEIIEATIDGGRGLPISVKTRIGNRKIITEDWIEFLLRQNPAVITVHGRTVAEQSKVPNHWDEIGRAVETRNKVDSSTLIIGNGDVKNRAEALEVSQKYGVDGVMIGRGLLENVTAFCRVPTVLSKEEGLIRLCEHVTMYEQVWGNTKPFVEVRRSVKMYVQGFAGAAELRNKILQAKNSEEVRKIAENECGDIL